MPLFSPTPRGDAVLHCCSVEPCSNCTIGSDQGMLCYTAAGLNHVPNCVEPPRVNLPNCVVPLEVITGCCAKLFCAIQRYRMLCHTAVPTSSVVPNYVVYHPVSSCAYRREREQRMKRYFEFYLMEVAQGCVRERNT